MTGYVADPGHAEQGHLAAAGGDGSHHHVDDPDAYGAKLLEEIRGPRDHQGIVFRSQRKRRY